MELEDDGGEPSHKPSHKPHVSSAEGASSLGTDTREHDVDAGWAWVVAGGMFLFNMVVGGTLRSIGLFYVGFNDIFPQSPAEIGVIGLSYGLCAMVTCPFGGIILDFLRVRPIIIVCSLIASLMIVCASLTTHLWVVIITFGVVNGGIMGILDSIILGSIGIYFRRRRALASGIIWTGSSVGNLVLPHLYTWLISEFGTRGGLFIMAGLWLHICIIGMLFIPIKKRKMRINESDYPNEVPVTVTGQHGTISKANMQQHSKLFVVKPAGSTEFSPMSYNSEELEISITNNSSYVTESSSLHMDQRDAGLTQFCNGEKGDEERPIFTPNTTDAAAGADTLVSPCDAVIGYIEFLANIHMWRVMIVIGCGMFSYYCHFQILPLWANEQQIPMTQAALVLSIIGSIELISRFTIGFVIDRFNLKPHIVLMIGYTIAGLAGQIVAMMSGIWPLVAYACVHGSVGGVAHIVYASMLGDVVPIECIGRAMGLLCLLMNIAAWPCVFVAGLMLKLTGTYRYMLTLGSAVYLAGALFYMMGPLLSIIQRRSILRRRK